MSRRAFVLWTLVDLVIIAGLAWLASYVWGRCAVGSEVAGDSFVALDCGHQYFEQRFARPSQQIFGWGLCASYAPLFAGVDSLWTVAWRRAMVAAALVPGTYVFVRLALPSLLRVSPFALRTAALCCALLIHQNERLGTASSTGTHGYMAYTWVLLCLVGVAIALRYRSPEGSWLRRAPGFLLAWSAAVVAFYSAPMAAMNHPDAAWIGLTLFAMLPLFVRRVGWIGAGVATLPGLDLAWSRIAYLREQMAGSMSFNSLAYQPGDWSLEEGELVRQFFDERYWPLTLGIVGITVLSLIWAKGREQRWVAASWAAGAVGAAVGFVFLARSVGYLQDYHVLLAFPIPVLGLALVLGRLCDLLARLERPPAPGPPAADPPSDGPPADPAPWSLPLGIPNAVVAHLVAAVMVAGTVVITSTDDGGHNPITDPWCNSRARSPNNSGTVAGSLRIGRMIEADIAANVADDVPVLITNFNLNEGRLDSAVSSAFAIVLDGWPRSRFFCCRPGSPPPVWYVIVDLWEPELDYLAWGALEDVDVLMHRPEVAELLIVIRTPEALAAIGEQLCEVIPPDRAVAVHYHEAVIDWMTQGNREGLEEPPSPVPPCLKRMQ